MSFKLLPSFLLGGLSFLVGASGCAGPASPRPENAALPVIDLEPHTSISTASFALG